MFLSQLTHWGRVTHICVGKPTIIGSDNGLSPDRRQAIIWTNAGILLIGPLGTNFNEILIKSHTFSFKKIHLKMSSGKWRPFFLGLNVLIYVVSNMTTTIVHKGTHCNPWFVGMHLIEIETQILKGLAYFPRGQWVKEFSSSEESLKDSYWTYSYKAHKPRGSWCHC